MQFRPRSYRILDKITDLSWKEVMDLSTKIKIHPQSERFIHKDMKPSTRDDSVHEDTDSSTELWIRPQDTRSSTKIQIHPQSYESVHKIQICPLSYKSVHVKTAFFSRRNEWSKVFDIKNWITKRSEWTRTVWGDMLSLSKSQWSASLV